MNNAWNERLHAAQDEGFNEKFNEGFDEGYLIGRMECIINIVKLLQDPSRPNKNKEKEILPEPFFAEVSEILKKYPNYSLEHQAKRVIYEATYLPLY